MTRWLVWCPCSGGEAPTEPWIYPDDSHADICGFAYDNEGADSHPADSAGGTSKTATE